jgi:hypothetical protein
LSTETTSAAMLLMICAFALGHQFATWLPFEPRPLFFEKVRIKLFDRDGLTWAEFHPLDHKHQDGEGYAFSVDSKSSSATVVLQIARTKRGKIKHVTRMQSMPIRERDSE